MKRLIMFFIFLVAFAGVSFAQQDIDNCFNYKSAGDYQRAIEAGKKAVKLYPRSPNAHFCLGDSYKLVGELNPALFEMKEAERLATAKDALMYIYNRIGMIYDSQGDADNALVYHSNSLSLARDLRNKKAEAGTLNNIALIYQHKGETDKALNYYEESLKLDDEKDKAPTYNNIAGVYNEKGDYQKAIQYYKKAIEISERSGDYHELAMYMLNLGNTYSEFKDFIKAEENLNEGLNRILKVGDKKWEATAYMYIGWLYRDKGEFQKAKDFLKRAYNLFESIGAKGSMQNVLLSLLSLDAQIPRSLYAGIEIGAKGVKGMVLELSPADEKGFYSVNEKMRRSINTGIISGVAQTGVFAGAAIEDTAKAVKELFLAIKNNQGVSEKDIFIAGSSALGAAKNKDALTKRVKEFIGIEMGFAVQDDEVFYNILGSIPEKYRTSALSIDVGSGNTKVGYIEKNGDTSRTVLIEQPLYGTVSFTDMIQKEGKSKKEFVRTANKVSQTQIADKLKQEIKRKPAIVNRTPVFMVGGIVWAMATLMHPENQESFVKLTAEDISRFYDSLSKNPDKLLSPDLSKIKDKTLNENISKQIQAIKDTFSKENLIAGARILKTLSEELGLKTKEIYFSRYGSWLWGYAATTGIDKEDQKSNK